MDELSRGKIIAISFVWFIVGYLCWLSSLYLFSFITGDYLTSLFGYIAKTSNSMLFSMLSHFVLFNITELMLTFLISFVLSMATGVRFVWSVLFYIANIFTIVLAKTTDAIETVKYYSTSEVLPEWLIYYIVESLTLLILFALFIWLGNTAARKVTERYK